MAPFPASTDVFVIGGGPAGLAAAIAARRAGFDVTVADGCRPPIDKACGEGIMPDGIAAARSLGIAIEHAGARPFRGIRFHAGGLEAQAEFGSVAGLALRRTALHQLMADHAAALGVRLLWGVPVAGIGRGAVQAGGRNIRTRWIVGADGTQSRVRRWAGLDAYRSFSRRFGFRCHYPVAPWTDFVEIHWGDGCQVYITPVAERGVCVVLVTRDPHLRLAGALSGFPDVARRLRDAEPERAGITADCRLQEVTRGSVALIGDASGSVDAITGEGLRLVFHQAAALTEALRSGDLTFYQRQHRRLERRPHLMASLLLCLERSAALRRTIVGSFAVCPSLFAKMLAFHTA